MGDNKKNLIVTAADKNYINPAKQLFSSLYFTAGWPGDYLLLTDNSLSAEDKNWFKNKGIIVYAPDLIDTTTFSETRKYPPLILSKLYLFQEYFKKWDTVTFVDADIIINASLDELLIIPGFCAAKAETFKLKDEFTKDKAIIKELDLNKKYNLDSLAFCAGIISFNTNIIKANTFTELLDVYQKNKEACIYGEESVLNLFFYKKWHKLHDLYNFNPHYLNSYYGIKTESIQPFIYHFFHWPKPWQIESPYYETWRDNLKKAEDINLQNRPAAKKIISLTEEKKYLRYIKIKKAQRLAKLISGITLINNLLGRLGLLIKKKYPRIYRSISLKKNDK